MQLHELLPKFIEKFAQQQLLRKKLTKTIDGEPEWVLAERQFMIQLTQETRKELGFPPVNESLILRAEVEALGHSDYYRKFPLYCAELALTGKLPTIW